MQCPLCETELREGATECTRCDWTRPSEEPPSHAKDWLAAVMSFVPGVGHLYKGHLVPGILLLLILGPLYLLVVFWLVPRTHGASLLLPAFFVFYTGYRAYHLPEVRGPEIEQQAMLTIRHWLSSPQRGKK